MFAVFAGLATIGIVVGFVLFSRLGTDRRFLALGVAGIILFASLTAFLVYDNDVAIATERAWSFTFSVTLRSSGSGTAWAVIPRTIDASLVSSLSVTAGQGNWSLVETPHGPGIYILYTGAVNLSQTTILYQPVTRVPDANLTMTTISANLVDASTWIETSANSAQSFGLYAWVGWQGGWSMTSTLNSGWGTYPSHLVRMLPGAVSC